MLFFFAFKKPVALVNQLVLEEPVKLVNEIGFACYLSEFSGQGNPAQALLAAPFTCLTLGGLIQLRIRKS